MGKISITKTNIKDLVIIEPQVFQDERGYRPVPASQRGQGRAFDGGNSAKTLPLETYRKTI